MATREEPASPAAFYTPPAVPPLAGMCVWRWRGAVGGLHRVRPGRVSHTPPADIVIGTMLCTGSVSGNQKETLNGTGRGDKDDVLFTQGFRPLRLCVGAGENGGLRRPSPR